MIIRDARPQDWAAIWPIWHRIAEAAETISWDPAATSEQAEPQWMRPAPTRVYVAEDEGAIVGSAQLGPNYGPASRVANATYIVDPDRHGRGIGRRLVQHTIDAARAAGFRSIVFNAVVETNTGAVRLYESMGFKVMTTIPEAFDHPTLGPVGLHVMHLAL